MRYPSKAGTPAIPTTSRAIAAIRLANQPPELRSNSISAPGQLRPPPSFPHWSDRVARRLGGVLPPRRGGPPERAGSDLLDLPAGVLLEPVLVTALRGAVAQAAPAPFLRTLHHVVSELRDISDVRRHAAGPPARADPPRPCGFRRSRIRAGTRSHATGLACPLP